MTYSKPEIAVLGDAARVIQGLGKIGGASDGIEPPVTPAYDLDE